MICNSVISLIMTDGFHYDKDTIQFNGADLSKFPAFISRVKHSTVLKDFGNISSEVFKVVFNYPDKYLFENITYIEKLGSINSSDTYYKVIEKSYYKSRVVLYVVQVSKPVFVGDPIYEY